MSEICVLPNYAYTNPSLESRTSITKTASSLLSSCRICLSTIFEPATLCCGHRFCEKCLNMYWQIRDKPDFIVCPLCRTNAFEVDFAKIEEVTLTQDFRKAFDPNKKSTDVISHHNHKSIICLKLSILMPMLYFLIKFLKPPFLSLLAFFSDLLVTLVYLV